MPDPTAQPPEKKSKSWYLETVVTLAGLAIGAASYWQSEREAARSMFAELQDRRYSEVQTISSILQNIPSDSNGHDKQASMSRISAARALCKIVDMGTIAMMGADNRDPALHQYIFHVQKHATDLLKHHQDLLKLAASTYSPEELLDEHNRLTTAITEICQRPLDEFHSDPPAPPPPEATPEAGPTPSPAPEPKQALAPDVKAPATPPPPPVEAKPEPEPEPAKPIEPSGTPVTGWVYLGTFSQSERQWTKLFWQIPTTQDPFDLVGKTIMTKPGTQMTLREGTPNLFGQNAPAEGVIPPEHQVTITTVQRWLGTSSYIWAKIETTL